MSKNQKTKLFNKETNTIKENLRKIITGSEELQKYQTDTFDIHQKSYQEFVQENVNPNKRENIGLEKVFRNFFPIIHNKSKTEVQYVCYEFSPPKSNKEECLKIGVSYVSTLKILLRTINLSTGEKKELWSTIGEMPIMTDTGTFIINGHERVFVSYLQKSPGVLFEKEFDISTLKETFFAKVFPLSGSWFHIELKQDKNLILISIDKKKKFSFLSFLLCFPKTFTSVESTEDHFDHGYDIKEILDKFYESETATFKDGLWHLPFNKINYRKKKLPHDIYKKEELIGHYKEGMSEELFSQIENNVVHFPERLLSNIYIAEDIFDETTGKITIEAGTLINKNNLHVLSDRKSFKFYVVDDNHPPFILNTLNTQGFVSTREQALSLWASSIKIGSHYGPLALGKMFEKRLSDLRYYDLGKGREKLNVILDNDRNKKLSYPDFEDMVKIVKRLFLVSDHKLPVDDLDNIANKNLLLVGDIFQNLFRIGMINFEKSVRDRQFGIKEGNFGDIFNFKIALYPYLESFTNMSQMLDNTNKASEIIQKRKVDSKPFGMSGKEGRVSGGLRYTNESKWGRICSTQTVEGKMVGLKEHLTTYARVNQNGFISTPYHPVKDGIASDEVVFLTAFEEGGKVFGSLNNYEKVEKQGKITYIPKQHFGEYMFARKNNCTGFFHYKDISYINVSNNQIFSTASSLLVFVNYNDPYRCLTSANQISQSLCPIVPEAPYCSTGMDRVFADVIRAKRDGIVRMVDYKRIVIEPNDKSPQAIIDIYNLTVNKRTNSDTSIQQVPKVSIGEQVKAGEIIADGTSTNNGELSLGKNLKILYQSRAETYEDSCLISDKVVREEKITTNRIEVFECLIKEARFGAEVHTKDVPGANSNSLLKLDEFGIITIGSSVQSGDVLVCKLTPNGPASTEEEQAPEKKLLNLFFGTKASDFTDNSLYVPNGVRGTVLDVQIFVKGRASKDGRSIMYEKKEEEAINNDCKKRSDLMKDFTVKKIVNLLKESKLEESFEKYKKNSSINLSEEEVIKRGFNQIKQIPINNKNILKEIIEVYEKNIKSIEEERKKRLKSISTYELAEGVLKLIKVYIANKTPIEVGDKICGRHGNKGIISTILPECDMPFVKRKITLPSGIERIENESVDVIIGPLGCFARMNFGQIIETTFGYAVMEMKAKLRTVIGSLRNKINEKDINYLKEQIGRIITENDLSYFNLSKKPINKLSDKEAIMIGEYFMNNGIHMIFEQFSHLSEETIMATLKSFADKESSKTEVFDGRTGEKYDGKMLCGYQYIQRLVHLVSLKMHARSTGPYNINTNQPTSGKSKFGGQKLGEMEMWSFEAYGASQCILESKQAKSDEVLERNRLHSDLVKERPYSVLIMNNNKKSAYTNSFIRLRNELRATSFELELADDKNIIKNECKIRLMGPEEIKNLSCGAVTQSESINYRTLSSIKGGLFCPKIFGTTKDLQCECGRYKGLSFKDIVCEKCEVQVTHSSVRNERVGHIELPVMVMHPWFMKTNNNKISLLLDIPLKEIKKVVNLEKYVITEVGESKLKQNSIISRIEFEQNCSIEGFNAKTGAEAIHFLLASIDLEQKIKDIKESLKNINSETLKKKCRQTLSLCQDMLKSNIRPEWMVLKNIIVCAPSSRPLVELDAGQFVSSDLNEIYRRVLYRCKRLNSIIKNKISIPLILHNEIRMIQDAVNKLFGIGSETNANLKDNERKLKSFEERIKGKEGNLRKFMLGNRVDFSGRSVIVVDAKLKINECYMPKEMVLEMLKPAIIGSLRKYGIALSVRHAKKLIDQKSQEVWTILNKLVEVNFPIMLLNRAPTLHRIGIMGFKIKLWDRRAIGINPLCCPAFNADFDGDQMAAHIPLSLEAQAEAWMLMMFGKNIGSPSSGTLTIGMFKDMGFGLFALTNKKNQKPTITYSSIEDMKKDLFNKSIHENDSIKILVNTNKKENKKEIVETCPGRVLFWEIIPKESNIEFNTINIPIDVKKFQVILKELRKSTTDDIVVDFTDKAKEIAFKYAEYFGGSFGQEDFLCSEDSDKIIQKGIDTQLSYINQIEEGLITQGEMRKKSVTLWSNINLEGARAFKKVIAKQQFNPMVMIVNSGSRGSMQQILQTFFIKGQVRDMDGQVSIMPILSNHRQGLDTAQYFLVSFGTRRSVTQVAINTADAGYFTRRLVDLAHSVIIRSRDCGTKNYFISKNRIVDGQLLITVFEDILNRVTALDIVNPEDKTLLIPKGTLITEDVVKILKEHEITEIPVRSVIFCEDENGACAACYGGDLSSGKLVNIGESVGVIAAQSIGEPGTQITMRSYHGGSVARFGSLVTETRTQFEGKVFYSKDLRIIKNNQGNHINISREAILYIKNKYDFTVAEFNIPYGATILKKHEEYANFDDPIASWSDHIPIIAEFDGVCDYQDLIEGINCETILEDISGEKRKLVIRDKISPQLTLKDKKQDMIYFLPENTVLIAKNGEKVSQGDIIAYTRIEADSSDIVGGLQKVVNILENRPPKRIATLASCEGIVEIKKDQKGKNIILIHDKEGKTIDHQVGLSTILVQQGQKVSKGTVLTQGKPLMQDLLDKRGIEKLLIYFLEDLQIIYRQEQGISINNKHFEIILQQMCRKHVVLSSKDENIMQDTVIDISQINSSMRKKISNEEIILKRIFSGITHAALNSLSFLSSASFQETLNVIIQAGLAGSVDKLNGLKENLITCLLLPTGTGNAFRIMKARGEKLQS